MSIGERIKSLRGQLSQDELANRLNVSKAAIGAYERNVSIPGSTFIISICEHFNVLFEWLLLGTGPMHPNDTPTMQESLDKTPTMASEAVVLCPQCMRLEGELEKEREERRTVGMENRQRAAKIEKLLQENGDLRERCATLTERMACSNSGQ